MSVVITCPECDAKLKMNAPIPAGKKVKCPKCSTSFAPASDEPEEEPAPRAGKEAGITAAPKAKRLAGRSDDEDDDRPRRRKSADDDEDIEDDRPQRSRKKKRKAGSGRMALVL